MAAAVTAGDLREPIDIYQTDDQADGSGGAIPGWRLWRRVSARVQTVRASEDETNGGLRQVQVCLFTIRRPVAAALDAAGGSSMRITWRGKHYDIREIRLGPPSEPFTEIAAESGKTQG
jgi:head-tail adaptor